MIQPKSSPWLKWRLWRAFCIAGFHCQGNIHNAVHLLVLKFLVDGGLHVGCRAVLTSVVSLIPVISLVESHAHFWRAQCANEQWLRNPIQASIFYCLTTLLSVSSLELCSMIKWMEYARHWIWYVHTALVDWHGHVGMENWWCAYMQSHWLGSSMNDVV